MRRLGHLLEHSTSVGSACMSPMFRFAVFQFSSSHLRQLGQAALFVQNPHRAEVGFMQAVKFDGDLVAAPSALSRDGQGLPALGAEAAGVPLQLDRLMWLCMEIPKDCRFRMASQSHSLLATPVNASPP